MGEAVGKWFVVGWVWEVGFGTGLGAVLGESRLDRRYRIQIFMGSGWLMGLRDV